MVKIFTTISDYYRKEKIRGHGPGTATLLLPRKGFLHYRRQMGTPNGKVDIVRGSGMYDKPLLASYSRSGTNWIRYVIEYISGRPTPGQVRLHADNRYVVDRAHKAFPVMDRYQKVVLVIRDYRECLLRHHYKLWIETQDVRTFLQARSTHHPPDWYIYNIEAYDTFRNDKLLVYYEDLLTEPHNTINTLANFLELDANRTADFLANLEDRYAESIAAYKSGGHASITTSRNRDPRHHANRHLGPEQQIEFDSFYASNYPLLFDKYLKRYATY